MRARPDRRRPHGSPPWSELAKLLLGRLVLPGDPGYPVSRALYNERFDSGRPAAIAYCLTPGDVQHTIAFARSWDVDLAVRSGGHSYGGYSTGPGLVLDVSSMSSVRVDGRTVQVGAGTKLVDLYAAVASAGLMVPGGSCPTVGIAGLALGGGIGVLGRRYGLTCDNLQSLDMVSADGRLVRASGAEEPDLYWASRGGGGGNFGVVTSFQFTAHPVVPTTLFTLSWPWAAAAEVVGQWQPWMRHGPDELWSNCQLLAEGAAGTHVVVSGVYCGEVPAAEDQLAALTGSVGAPTSRSVDPESFLNAMLIEAGCEHLSVAQCHLPSQDPAGVLSRSSFAAKSLFIDEPLPDTAGTALIEAMDEFHQQFPYLGGAVV
ncbi:MAG TPA: FAD-dependent oxidoreductase, partial [Acidimicrobiales bacterium]|nr:FAD-dependent oxidoreductase [Acidimicrobiales bacterium]